MYKCSNQSIVRQHKGKAGPLSLNVFVVTGIGWPTAELLFLQNPFIYFKRHNDKQNIHNKTTKQFTVVNKF